MNKEELQQLIDQIKTKLQMIWVNELRLPVEVQTRMMALMDIEIDTMYSICARCGEICLRDEMKAIVLNGDEFDFCRSCHPEDQENIALSGPYTQNPLESIGQLIDHLKAYCPTCGHRDMEFYQYPANSDSELYICMNCEVRAIKIIPVEGEITQNSENYGTIKYGSFTWTAYRPQECLRCKKQITPPYLFILLKYSSMIAWVLCTICQVAFSDFLSGRETVKESPKLLSSICSEDCKSHPAACHDCEYRNQFSKSIAGTFMDPCYDCHEYHCDGEFCTNGHPWQLYNLFLKEAGL